jgi:hypothetical protein
MPTSRKNSGMYAGVLSIFRTYWCAYGGWVALLKSPYLHAAFVLLALTFHNLMQKDWWESVISILPNLLGFTLGGFAIFIGFGDERFRALLADPDSDQLGEVQPTIYVALCATFVHFILIQLLALIYAIVAKSMWFQVDWPSAILSILPYCRLCTWAIGYGLFLYALTSVLAATMHILRIAQMYEQFRQHQTTSEQEDR